MAPPKTEAAPGLVRRILETRQGYPTSSSDIRPPGISAGAVQLGIAWLHESRAWLELAFSQGKVDPLMLLYACRLCTDSLGPRAAANTRVHPRSCTNQADFCFRLHRVGFSCAVTLQSNASNINLGALVVAMASDNALAVIAALLEGITYTASGSGCALAGISSGKAAKLTGEAKTEAVYIK